MITVFEIGGNGIWTGATREIGEADGLLGPWTRSPVPALAEGEYAEFDGIGWRIVTAAEWLDVRKRAKRDAVSALIDAKLSGGYVHNFGEPFGEKRLQTRNIEDRTNWLTSQASYSAAVAGGAGAIMGAAFRSEDNVNITLSYADGLDVLLAMAGWGAAHYARSWALKDLITAAEDEAALEAIDIESGWPA